MSERNLPEDLSLWPDDPYELLGVRPGVAPRDLRRAYVRLIRTYKPEQYPDHFRHIRAAYESVLRFAQFFGSYSPGEDETPAEGQLAEDNGSAAETLPMPMELDGDADGGTLPMPVPLGAWRRGLDPLQEMHDAWERACSGDEAEAYRRLREMHDNRPGDTDLCVRLYWLLGLAPELDSHRSPVDWLMSGLRASGLTGPLRELFRREIADSAAVALGDGCRDLVRAAGRPPGAVLDLLEWRWAAANTHQHWDVLLEDLHALRARFLEEDEEAWARLLLLATDHLAWAAGDDQQQAMVDCVRELERANHLHNLFGDALDRLDFLRSLAEAWRTVRHVPYTPVALCRLIQQSWSGRLAKLRPAVEAFLAEIAERPKRFLDCFDLLQEPKSAVVLTQYGKILLDYAVDAERRLPEDECSGALAQRVLEHAAGLEMQPYANLRDGLLTFCLREAVSPVAIARVVGHYPAYRLPNTQHLSTALESDWPLRYVFLSCFLFWS